MFVTVWYKLGLDTFVASDEHIPLDTPLCDLRFLFPGSKCVTLDGDSIPAFAK